MNPLRPTNGTSDGDPVDGFRRASLLKFFYVGIGVKRWLLIGALGIGVCAFGLAFLLRKLFALTFPDFLPSHFEGALLLAVGLTAIAVSLYGLARSVGPHLLGAGRLDSLAEAIYGRRSRGRGPRIVVIGGGTGLAVLLRGLKEYSDHISAIVTVADDGGSSGRLRRELGLPPPGDFRNCLVAMAESESLVTELFQHRFSKGTGLDGHSFGNLFIAALTEVTGSFERAVYESSRVLAVRGQILPATLDNLQLSALLTDGTVLTGESTITARGGQIKTLSIEPADAEAYGPAIDALRRAQIIVVGPGSLYTSILPNLLVSGIADAVRESGAPTVYVCNVATEKGETDGYTVADHVEALRRQTSHDIVDWVVANDRPRPLGSEFLGIPVVFDSRFIEDVRVELADLTDPEHPVRHDSARLAKAVMDIFQGKRGVRTQLRSVVQASRL